MAINPTQRSKVVVTVDGQEATNTMDALQRTADSLKTAIEGIRSQPLISQDDLASLKELEKEYNQVNAAIGRTKRQNLDLEAVLNNLSGQTLRDLQASLRTVKASLLGASEDNGRLDIIRQQYKAINDQINKLKGDSVNVTDVLNNLDIASENMMRQALVQLRELRSETLRGTGEWDAYDKKIRAVETELDKLSGKKVVNSSDVMANINLASSNEINAAIAQMEKLRNEQVLGSAEWQKYGTDIQQAKEYLAQFTQTQKMSVSDAQGMSAMPGNFSAKEIKEAIRVLQEFKDTLKTSDTTGIQQVEQQINALSQSLVHTERQFIRVGDIIKNPANFNPEQIKAAIKQVEDSLNRMTMGNANRGQRERQLENLKQLLAGVKSGAVDVNDVLSRLKSAPIAQLESAAKQLDSEIKNLNTDTDEYVKKQAEYKQIKDQIDDLTKSHEKTGGAIKSVMNRLIAYIGIYGAFNLAKQKISEMITGNLELSDSLADVQKTTGLTAVQVGDLSKEIDKLDTRTAQQQLHELAYEAGKLGISAKEDVMEFVKAGNQVVVALGEDLGGAESIKELMKINDVLGETQKLGVEKALLATGSAINEVGQNSTASEGYMADFAKRLGGIAAQSKLTMAELIAMGGTTDALGQNVEVSATAMNKFIVALQTNTRGVAMAAGVSDTALQSLIDSGRTMEAMIMVLEGLGKRGGLAELAPLMGDLGSDGARLTAVLSSLAGNTEMLRGQLYIAKKGFEEATSVTDEYNVKNESAAAILQRIGNTIREMFVNAGWVYKLKEILSTIADIPNALSRNVGSLTALKSILTGIVTVLSVKGLLALKAYLGTLGLSTIPTLTASFIALKTQIIANTVGVTGLSKAWKVLKTVMKSNLFGIIATAAAAVAFAIYDFVKATTSAKQAVGDAIVKIEEESYSLNKLKKNIDSASSANGERQSLISQFNTNYKTYLGYMLSESASADDIARAYKAVNAELHRKNLLTAKEEALSSVSEKYRGGKVSVVTDLRSQLESNYGVPADVQVDMVQYIQELVDAGTGSAESILEQVEKKFGKKRGIGKRVWDAVFQNGDQVGVTSNDLYPLIQKFQRFAQAESKELENVAVTFDGEIAVWAKKSINERQAILNEWAGSIFPKDGTYSDQSKKDIESYISLSKLQLKSLEEKGMKQSEQYAKIERNMDNAATHVKAIKKDFDNPWGEGIGLESASVEKLAGRWKELWQIRSTINKDKSYEGNKQFKNSTEEMAALMMQLNKYEARLKELGANKYGKPLRSGGSGSQEAEENKELRAQKKLMDEMTADLNAYYMNKENQLKESFLNEQMTSERMNQEIEQNQQAHNLATAELRKAFLNQESGFFAKQYGMTDEQQQKLNNLTLTDEKTISDQQVKLTEALNREKEIRVKHRQEIEKILLENDPMKKNRDEYRTRLEELGLFQRSSEQLDKESADKRMDLLTAFSKNSRGMTADMLQQGLESNELFAQYTKDMKQEEYAALLLMLQQYLDDSEEAEANAKARRTRTVDKMWKQSDEFKGATDWVSGADEDTKSIRDRKIIGMADEEDVNDAEIIRSQARMEALQMEIDFKRSMGEQTIELDAEMQEHQQEMDELYLEGINMKMEKMREYTDSIVTFGEEMGMAAFGEVEDRKAAGKKLINSLMDTTKKLVIQWATRKAMNLFFKQQENVDNATQAATSVAITTGRAGAEAGINVGKAGVDVAAGIASGTAKEVGSKGWVGLAIGAAIAITLGVLLSAAQSKLTSSFSGESAGSGTSGEPIKRVMGRGALTYASGNVDKFPVLGDDGKTYHPKPINEVKTGVYRSPHLAVFGEKGDEMVISAPTTRKLMLDYPNIVDNIQKVDRGERVRMYASGNVNELAPPVNFSTQSADMSRIADAIAQTNAINQQLIQVLQKPITANIDKWGKNGLVEQVRNGDKFLKERKR